MPSVSEVFLRVRVDSSELKQDIERAADGVDGKSSGQKFGRTFGSSGAAEASKSLGKTITGHDWEGDGKASGTRAGKGIERGVEDSVKQLGKVFRDSGKNTSSVFSDAFKGGLTSPAGIGAAIGAGLVLAPGVIAAAGALTGVGLGAAILYSTDAKFKAGVGELGTSIKATAVRAVHDSGLAGALESELGRVNATVDKIGPELTGLFRAVTPEVAPIGKMFSDLVTGTLPGFVSLMRQSEVPLEHFFGTAGKLIGTRLGDFFRELGPSVGPSLTALTGLLQVTTDLLPVMAQAARAVSLVVTGYEKLPGPLKAVLNPWKDIDGVLRLFEGSSGGAAKGAQDLGSKALAAAPKVGTLTGDVAILNTSVTSASTALSAYNDAWNLIIGRSLAQQQAVLADRAAFDALRSSMKSTGAQSTASRQAFVSYMQQIGSSITTLMQNGASVRAVNTAYATSIGHLRTLHGLNGTQKGDISALIRDYDTWANSAGGLNRQTQTAAQTLRTQFIAQLTKIHSDSPGINRDITNLSNAILKTGTQSSATKGDRAQLIRDLEQAGLKADSARRMADSLTRSIKNIPPTRKVSISEAVSGKGTVSIAAALATGAGSSKSLYKNPLTGPVLGKAAGGYIRGPGGPTSDSIPARLSDGEYVVRAAAVKAVGVEALDAINSGLVKRFAAGGLVNGSVTGAGVAAANGNLIRDTVDYTLPLIRAASQASLNALIQSLAGGYSAVPARSGSAAAAQAFARAHLAQFGWGADQMAPLIALWNQESGWNANAVNPSSGAYGIPQALGHGHPYNLGDYANQVMWGLGYIRDRYGSPAAAERHELANHWYAGGGAVNEPVFGIGQRSGASYVFGEAGSEQVIGNADIKTLIGQNAQMIELMKRTPGAFAASLNARKGSEMWAARKALGG